MERLARSPSPASAASTSADGRRRRRGLGSDGFSLVEAIAAAGLLSVVTLGAALGADRAVRFNTYSRTAATATTLVHDKIEELQSKPVVDPSLTAGTHTDASNPITATGEPNGTYTRSWVVTDNTPTTGLKTVAVSVSWPLYGQTHTIRVVSVKQ